MTIPVIVNGARGKMGRLACEAISAHPELTLAAGLTKEDDLRAVIADTQARVVVDLTRTDVVYANARAIIESGACPVIGTTGLADYQIQILNNLCYEKDLSGIIVPNFSISAALMIEFAEMAARYLPDVEIIEFHHQEKYEAPSGTALQTAERISHQLSVKLPRTSSHELVAGVRGGLHTNIPIHSVRLPGIVARQDVIFGNKGETLTITHNCIDRIAFMPGIIMCCLKVQDLEGLHYGLDALFDD